MKSEVTKAKIKPQLLRYLRRVERTRRSFTITSRGHPVARLVPYVGKSADPLEQLAGSVVRYEDPLAPVGEEDWVIT